MVHLYTVENLRKRKGIKMETQVITRKIQIIPTSSENKEWTKKIYNYAVKNLEDRIEKNESLIKKAKKDKKIKKDERQRKIERYENFIVLAKQELEDVVSKQEFTNSMVNNYTKTLIKEAMESEARRKNYILAWAFSRMIEDGVQYMEFKEQMKYIGKMLNPAYRVKGSKKGSIFDDVEIKNILGGYGVAFSQTLTNKIKDVVKDGVFNGKVSLPTYKMDSPVTINKSEMGFTHDYDSYEELCEHLDKEKCKIYFNYGSGGKPTIARFFIEIKNKKNEKELKSVLMKVFSGEYEYGGSSIQFAKKDTKIILNLTLKIPKQELKLDENTVVGVDLGQAIPAVCALNNNDYSREFIGSVDDFLRVRTQLQSQRRRLQKTLKMTSGGHGRKKKLKPLEKLSDRERNFVKTYNHKVSKEVVDFAIKNNAKYINLESLKGYDTNKFILRNWSYYELQQFITYKATKYGIEVRKINQCYTSQVCSCCGHWEEGQRIDQAHYKCKSCGAELNADFNAARNIAKSTLWFDGEVKERQRQEARDYYGIVKSKNKEEREENE